MIEPMMTLRYLRRGVPHVLRARVLFFSLILLAGTSWAAVVNVASSSDSCVASLQPDPYVVVHCGIQDAVTDAGDDEPGADGRRYFLTWRTRNS
jgi:hypothetical protein